jgi:excisionase family DNA binding protein
MGVLDSRQQVVPYNAAMGERPAIERLAYTAAEVAVMLGVSERHVYESCKRGELPHLKIGRRIVFPHRRFDEWFGLGDQSNDGSALLH